MLPDQAIKGVYDYRLVALSVFIAIVAAYAALDLAGRITTAKGKTRIAWLTCGGLAMGIGIWAMHYVGMAALYLPIPVLYNWPTVVLSAFAAVAASTVALFVVSRPTMTRFATVVGSLFMGTGIAAMHYIGMGAMRMPAMCQYSAWLVTLSIVLAMGISYAALSVQFAFRAQVASWSIRKFAAAILLGSAIPTMHYVGMAAVTMVAGGSMGSDLYAEHLSPLGLARIVVLSLCPLFMVIVISVGDRRRALQYQRLSESQMRLQSIFDNMTEGVVVLDLQKNIVEANRAAMVLLGLSVPVYPLGSILSSYEISSANGAPLPRDQWPGIKAMRGEFVRHIELMIQNKDTDHTFIAEISTTPVKNHAGKVIQIIVSYRDISDRKFNTDNRARLAAIVESSADAIIGKDEAGLVRSWNAAAEKIFGYTAEEMIGQSIMRLIPTGREEEEQDFVARLTRGEVVDHVETERRTKSCKLVYVSLTISPIRDSNGKVVGASKIARDITARKQMERQLQQSQKMEAVGQLTGGIAHDFNNLLAVIVGNLTLLERLLEGNVNATKRLHTAHKAASRGADLTRRLLAFSSNEELQPVSTNLGDSIRNMLELAGRTLGPDIKIIATLDSEIPAIFVDPAGLESALLNLAVNARDAMPRGGTLTITTELVHLEKDFPPVKTGEMKPGSYASVSVTDTGSGMSRETMERALEPFFTTKPRGKGTGLGLAMVYGFVKQSGGAVRLYSEIGYGSTVTFYLQLDSESPRTMPKAAIAEIHPPPAAGTKVLIVDDELDILDIASTYLTDMGYTAFTAPNGAAAFEIVKHEQDVALVITDVIMPGGMNGAELVEKIRRYDPYIKVIYSSGFPAGALSERSGTVLDGLLLHKPYQKTEFDAIVRKTLRAELIPTTATH